MTGIGKTKPTHPPISHVPKDPMYAPKGLCDIEGNLGEVRLVGPLKLIRHTAVGGSELVKTASLGLRHMVGTAAMQQEIDLPHRRGVGGDLWVLVGKTTSKRAYLHAHKSSLLVHINCT